jgi:hydrogenase maturation factor
MRPSLAILAVAALLMIATPVVVGEVYQAGEGAQPVVVLVDALGETEKSWVDAVAESQGAAVGMIATDVFTGAPGNETAELLAAMESNGLESSTQHPVMGIGNAAYHSLLLSYDAWVSASLCLDFVALDAMTSEIFRPHRQFFPEATEFGC